MSKLGLYPRSPDNQPIALPLPATSLVFALGDVPVLQAGKRCLYFPPNSANSSD